MRFLGRWLQNSKNFQFSWKLYFLHSLIINSSSDYEFFLISNFSPRRQSLPEKKQNVFFRKRTIFATNIFLKKIKILKNYFVWKKIIQNQKVPKSSWKENFLNKVPKKVFFRKKFTKKYSFRKNISKLIFFKNSILQKNFTKIFVKNLKKNILEIFISIFE